MNSLPDGTEPATTIDAAWVVTMDGPDIPDGRVVVRGDRIAAVGPARDVAPEGRRIDLASAVLLPGLINAHCHLELSAYHGQFPPGDLWSWLVRLVAARSLPGAGGREQAAVAPAARSMLAAGTTCVGDVSRAAWLPGVLADLPIRKVCYVELISGAPSAPGDMQQLRGRLADLPRSDLLHPAISPHAPYTVTRDDLEACACLAAECRLPLAIHLAETRQEAQWLRDGTGPIRDWHSRLLRNPLAAPGCGPVAYAMDTGLVRTGRTALIHMNYAEDWQLLARVAAEQRPTVVFCPRSSRFFGHDAHPFGRMLAAGIPVAIGTDSAASHPAGQAHPLSVLEELRFLHGEHPKLPAETLLGMATVHGAAAVGLADRIGRIRRGYQADLVAFELDRTEGKAPLGQLLTADHQAMYVLVAGRHVCE